MNILINASNIRKSGALQVTLSFLEEVKKITRHRYLIVLSDEVAGQVDASSFPANCRLLHLSTGTPGSKGFMQQVRKLADAGKAFTADVVFSVFAPTYWTPAAPHLAGFAYVWAINPDAIFMKRLSLQQRVKTTIENAVKKYFIKKNAGWHVVEEDDVKRRLAKYFGIHPGKIFVVNNTYNHHFNHGGAVQTFKQMLPEAKPGDFKLVTISSNFPHKNLKVIPAVSAALKARGYNNVYFYLTIRQDEFIASFGGDDNIRNLGVVAAADCPAIYAQSDALFLPTMLECFSASYPEAMVMKKPVLTSDLSFARSICRDAAVYFSPIDPADIAEKIVEVMTSKTLYDDLVAKGLRRVQDFPSAAQRAAAYIALCEQIVNNGQPLSAVYQKTASTTV